MFVVLTVCLVLGHTGRPHEGRLLCFQSVYHNSLPRYAKALTTKVLHFPCGPAYGTS